MNAGLTILATGIAALALAPPAAASARDKPAPAFPACLDKVTTASGHPPMRFDPGPGAKLDRRPARPGDATGWYAVDRRDNGCPVLVRMGDPTDVRPAEPARLRTAEAPRAAR